MKQINRKDFDLTKEYRVNVEGCSEELKKKVQQAFFDVGLLWKSGAKEYLSLDAEQYTNTDSDGNVVNFLMYSRTTSNCNMSAEEFLELVYEPEQQGHIHAELMAMYAEDAKTHAEPWKLWEFRIEGFAWCHCTHHPHWDEASDYRRKPKTHLVHGVEIPDLRVTPKNYADYWCPSPTTKGYVIETKNWGCTNSEYRIENGLCYEYTKEGEQAAILHAKAMLGIAT